MPRADAVRDDHSGSLVALQDAWTNRAQSQGSPQTPVEVVTQVWEPLGG